MNKTPQNKVAVLRIPADEWESWTPQQQLLYVAQQCVGFLASPFYADMEGMRIQVIDPNNIAKCKVVLQVGKPPQESGLVIN